MSTLGDLLAEHTVLPGNAVDHLHAVVGEWQLLADLSFADFLMWVRRDDGALVCVAQVRPNTAPTVLLADAVGTLNQGDRDAGGDRCVQLRRHRQAKPSGTTGFTRSQRRGCSRALQQQRGRGADASDRAGRGATPARWRAPTWTAPATCCSCCPRAPSPTSGTSRCRGRARASATASSGSTATGRRHVRQPQRDLGLSPDGPCGRTGGPQPGHRHPAADLRPVRGPGTGRPRPRLAGRRVEHAHGGRRGRRRRAAAHAAAGGARQRRRCRRC